MYQEMKLANEKLMSALEENNVTDADISQTYYNNHVDEFQSIQKRIDSYQKRVDESKDSYLETKRKVYCFQFDMINRGSKVFVDFIKELMYHDSVGKYSNNTIELLKSLQSNLKKFSPMIQSLHKSSLEELKSNPAQFSAADNNMMQLFDDLLLFLESYDYAWNYCVLSDPQQQAHESPVKPSQHAANRMVFATKKDKP